MSPLGNNTATFLVKDHLRNEWEKIARDVFEQIEGRIAGEKDISYRPNNVAQKSRMTPACVALSSESNADMYYGMMAAALKPLVLREQAKHLYVAPVKTVHHFTPIAELKHIACG